MKNLYKLTDQMIEDMIPYHGVRIDFLEEYLKEKAKVLNVLLIP